MNQKRSLTILAVLMAAALAASGCSMIDSLKARDHINKGVEAYTAEDYAAAVEHFSAAAELDPELLVAKLYIAHSYRAQWIPGIPDEANEAKAYRAIEAFEEVLQDDPNNTNALASIAGIYDGLNESDKAKEWYNKRIAVEPDNPEPYYGIGAINQRLSHELTGQDGSNVENLTEEELEQAKVYTDQGIEMLEKALDLNEEYADAVEYLNLIYREKAYLAADEDEKESWQRRASQLALKVIELRRKQQLEEERERREFFKTDKDSEGR